MPFQPSLPPPNIPETFARPVPAQFQPAPSDALNRPGPFGAQGAQAPRLGVPNTVPPPAAAPIAVGGGAAAGGGGILVPAAVLAGPLAIGAGEFGMNPITSGAAERDAIRRANQGGIPDPFAPYRNPSPDAPNPTNPPQGAKKPDKARAPTKPGPGRFGQVAVTGRTVYASGSVDVDTLSFPGNENDVWTFSSSSSGTSLLRNGQVVYPVWSKPPSQGGGSVSLVRVVFTPSNPFPPPPGNPSQDSSPAGNPAPKIPNTPNPAKPQTLPNPANPIGSTTSPAPNPTIKNPPVQRPALPGENPANPTPKLPGTPNPANPNPGQPANPTQPAAPKIPALPNPAQPTQPAPIPDIPAPKIPDTPNPAQPGPIVPTQPGPIIPTLPGPIVPSNPVPVGPSNPKRDPCSDPCVENLLNKNDVVSIKVKEFVDCDRNLFGVPLPFDKISVSVPRQLASALEIIINNQAEILKALNCESCDEPIAAIPEWWPIRLGANRPQLVVLYARKFNDGTWDRSKYAISIPHWTKTKEQTKLITFPTYDKGDYQGTRVFSDNSKLIVNCLDEQECQFVLDDITAHLPSEIASLAQTSIANRKGDPLRKITVYPRRAKYFSTGQRDTYPDWSIKIQ